MGKLRRGLRGLGVGESTMVWFSGDNGGWIDPEHPEIFYARGILGQYIIVIPSKKTILVRLGKKTAKKRIHTVPTEVRHLINWGLASE